MELGYQSFLIHCFADYWLQNDWMALNKKKDFRIALLHSAIYTLPFLILTQSILALFIIFISHAIIDGTDLICKLNQIKNWNFVHKSGYNEMERPQWIWIWLLIFQDNILHLIINYLSIKYL